MKKLLYNIIGATCLAGALASCSDFLEIKPQNETIFEDFWNQESDVEQIMAGCYTALQSDAVVRRMIIWGEGRTDNVQIGTGLEGNDPNLADVIKENIKATNPYTNWDAFYTIINRCNTLIKYAPMVAEEDPGYTQSELKAHIAEASALRDLCYFYLIRTFKNVPYTTEAFIDDDQELALPPTSFDQVLDYLIADLEQVQAYATVTYPGDKLKVGYQTGRITKCAIHAMLCEMYLWKKDYKNCVKYADLVINHMVQQADLQRQKGNTGNYLGADESRFKGAVTGITYPLLSEYMGSNSYGNAYNKIFGDGLSSETIFELVYDKDKAGDGMPTNSACGDLYLRRFMSPSSKLVEDVAATSGRTFFTDKSQKLDARLYENMTSDGEVAKFVYHLMEIDASNTSNVLSFVGMMQVYDAGKKQHRNSSNWIIYRLTDIMLLKAEALVEMVSSNASDEADISDEDKKLLDQAFELVNVVNMRAICKTTLADGDASCLAANEYATKNAMQELVLDERQRELLFEGKRWYDLVRRSMRDGNTVRLLEATNNRNVPNSAFVQNFFSSENGGAGMNAIFWPYNNEETKVNPYLKDAQNPAFNSGENSSYSKN